MNWRRWFTIILFKTCDFGKVKSSYRRRSPSIKLSDEESWEPKKRSHRLESLAPTPSFTSIPTIHRPSLRQTN